jgi:hypothetical protein
MQGHEYMQYKNTLSISVLNGTVASDSFVSIGSFLGRRFIGSQIWKKILRNSPKFNVFSIFSHGKITRGVFSVHANKNVL